MQHGVEPTNLTPRSSPVSPQPASELSDRVAIVEVFLTSSVVDGQTVIYVLSGDVSSVASTTTSSLVSSMRIGPGGVESYPHTHTALGLQKPASTTQLTGTGHVTLTPMDVVFLGVAVATPPAGHALKKRFRL